MARAFAGTAVGAVICAFLSAATFVVLTVSDGASLEEALLYGSIAFVVGALIGAVIGLAVGMGKLGMLGGAIAGALAVAAVAVVYVLVFSRPGQYGYFLSESRVIVVVLAAPAILTGILTALFTNKLS